MTGSLEVPSININSIDPADTATLFGTNSSGDSIFHIRIGDGSADKIQFESWNGSSATGLIEVTQTDVNILGNLNVSGTTTTIDSETLAISDNEIVLNDGFTGTPSLDAGILIERGSETDSSIKWNETTNEWEVGLVGATLAIMTYNNSTKAAGRFYTGATDATNTNRLNYDGYFYATRVYNAVYNDLAEFMPKAEDAEAGQVLVMTEKGLTASKTRGDCAVVGVFSDTFGQALGADDQENKLPVGISGRVNVWVSEEVKIGDQLISGDETGFASVKRTSEDGDGKIIGKAMQNKSGSDAERISMIIALK